jgi:hypothetical protein
MTRKILTEALVVGIALVVIGMVLHLVASKIKHHNMNDNFVLAVHFFIAGFALHLIAEYAGWNKWYCSHGAACLAK